MLGCTRCRLTPPVWELSRRDVKERPTVPVQFLCFYLPQRRISACISGYKTTALHMHVIEKYDSCSLSSFWIVIFRLFCVLLWPTVVEIPTLQQRLYSECEIPSNFWHSSSELGRFQHNASIVNRKITNCRVWGGHHQHEFEEGETQQRRIIVDFIQLRGRS